MLKFRFLLLWLLMYSGDVLTAQTLLQKTVVWEEKEGGNYAHFVYGLTITHKGSILAFAEARIETGADDGAHHITMKRSTDQGLSFSNAQLIVESKNGQSWANPTVVQDQQTKEIFLFYALNHKNATTTVFYKSSKDDGLSWSVGVEITALFTKNAQEWTFHLPGPGHGIQLKNNRLIVPVWHRKSIAYPTKDRRYGVNCLYSDDHGQTWKVGGDTPVGELNESQVVAKANGDLLLIGRTINPNLGTNQAKVWSKDQGETWTQQLQYDKSLSGRVCDIGLTALHVKSKIWLVSQPADPKSRKDLTIRLSRNEGNSWPVSKILEEGGATYSDLAVLPDRTIVCLYGHGGTEHMPKKVSLARFNLAWLLQTSK